MGYNPHRKHRASTADYVLLAAALLVAAGLVAWGFWS
jgi:hypothetical protein